MEALLALYARPYNAQEPVICLAEKSNQLRAQTRSALPLAPGAAAKEDCAYRRAGTRNIFVAVEPKGGRRQAAVTARRTKADFVRFVQQLAEGVSRCAQKIHVVLDNLNTHFRGSFVEVMGAVDAERFQARVEFHDTPKHASWLNMAEMEIGILERPCTGRRLGSEALLVAEVAAWQERRNTEGRTIEWKFTAQDAKRKLSRHYVT